MREWRRSSSQSSSSATSLARAACAAALVAVALLALPARASANGDPCSDQLTISDICIPSGANLPPSATKELANLLTEISQKGSQIKVAVIANPGDLGLIPQLFGKPQLYARFLGQEILYTYDGILLVVMKSGYGVFHGRQSVTRGIAALRVLPKPRSGKVADLVAAAVLPTRRLAAIAGTPAAKHKSSNDTRDRLVIAIAAVVLIALTAAGVEVVRSRRKRT